MVARRGGGGEGVPERYQRGVPTPLLPIQALGGGGCLRAFGRGEGGALGAQNPGAQMGLVMTFLYPPGAGPRSQYNTMRPGHPVGAGGMGGGAQGGGPSPVTRMEIEGVPVAGAGVEARGGGPSRPVRQVLTRPDLYVMARLGW